MTAADLIATAAVHEQPLLVTFGWSSSPHASQNLSPVNLRHTEPRGMSQARPLHQGFFHHEPLENTWLFLEGCLREKHRPHTSHNRPIGRKAPGPVFFLDCRCLWTRSSRSSRKPQKINQLLSCCRSSLSRCHVAGPWCHANYHRQHQSHFSKHGQTNSIRASQVLKHSGMIVKAKNYVPVNISLGSS